MKHIKVLKLNEGNRLKLEQEYHNSLTSNYRIRCKSTELKSSVISASGIAEILDVSNYSKIILNSYLFTRVYIKSLMEAFFDSPLQSEKFEVVR